MALFETVVEGVTETWLGKALLVVGAVMAAPALFKETRPFAKKALKGGIIAFDKTRGFVAEAGEKWSDLVAEARSELTASPSKATKNARPLAKRVIRGGMTAFNKTRELVAEVGEQWSDLVAEARSELATPPSVSEKKKTVSTSTSKRTEISGATKSRAAKSRRKTA